MRRTRVSSLAALGLAAIFMFTGTLSAGAATAEWSAPVTLSPAGQTAIQGQLVTDGTTTTAAWVEDDGDNYHVHVATSVDGGLTWSTPSILPEPGQGANNPQLVTDGTTTTVTWFSYDGNDYNIQASSSIDGGVTWSTPASLSDPGYSAFYPQLVTDGTTTTVIWQRYDGNNYRIQAASSIDGGLTWSTPVNLSADGGNAAYPQLVQDGTTITAIWERSDGINSRVQVSSSVDGGLTWSTPVTLSEAGGTASSSQLVTDDTTITATWYRSDGSNDRIQTASSVDGGLTWSTPVTLSEAGGSAGSPQLVTDGTTITATWYRNDGSNDRIQTASSVDGGLSWSTPVTLSEAGGNADSPQLVTDGTTITATWSRNDGDNNRIQMASSVDGGLTWSTPLTLSEAGQRAYEPQLVTDGTTAHAIWHRHDGSNYRIQVASTLLPVVEPVDPGEPEVTPVDQPAAGELAATGANASLATGLLAGGLLLAGGVLVAARVRGRRTA